MELPCKLTPDEIFDKGRELARLLIDLERKLVAEAERHKTAREANNVLQDEINTLAIVVKSGIEKRDVEVQSRIDGTTVVMFRCDTGEAIDRRPAKQDELQLEING